MKVTVATPKGYEPAREIVRRALSLGGDVTLVREQEQAVTDAEVIVTDTWISMGDEGEKEERVRIFKNYTVDASLMRTWHHPTPRLCRLPSGSPGQGDHGRSDGGRPETWYRMKRRTASMPRKRCSFPGYSGNNRIIQK